MGMKRMLAALLLLAAPSLAGPPAICWPVEIGEAKVADGLGIVEIAAEQPDLAVLVAQHAQRTAPR